MLLHFGMVFVFLMTAIIFVIVALFLSKLVRPDNPSALKNQTYECGEEAVGSGWLNFNMRFYVIGLIFLVFDVEIAFIYPVAVVYKDWIAQNIGAVALLELMVFLGILAFGLVYVWVKGDLEWVRDFVRGGKEPMQAFEKPIAPAMKKDPS